MSNSPAGWYSDPYGRSQQRYFDGTNWTEHISSAGVQSVDPMGASTVAPMFPQTAAFPATPAEAAPQAFASVPSGAAAGAAASTTATAGGTGGGSGLSTLLDAHGPDARERPDPTLQAAAAGVGGLIVGSGLAGLIGGDDASRGKVFAAAAVILAIALGIRLALKQMKTLNHAAVGLGVIGIALLGGALMINNLDGAGALFLWAALFIAAWALPGFRGRTVMLGLGALFAVFGLAAALQSEDCENIDGFEFCESDFSGNTFDILPDPIANITGDQTWVFLVAGGLLAAGVWWLDRRGYRGTATGLVPAMLISSAVGVATAAEKIGDNSGASLLIIAVGVAVALVGSHGERRATTWWGVALTTAGVLALVINVIKPTSTQGSSGALILAGLLLIGVPTLVATIRKSNAASNATPTGSGPLTPPPPPSAPLPPPSA